MANGIFGASRERVGTLMAAGCPLDFPEALPGPSFRAEPLAGYAGSCVYAFPFQAVWLMASVSGPTVQAESSSPSGVSRHRGEPICRLGRRTPGYHSKERSGPVRGAS